MKKRVLLIFVFSLILFSFFINASEADVEAKAISCLQSKVENQKCSSLSTEEKIFTLLATGKCKSEVIGDSKNSNSECWPGSSGSSCSIKTTAQAILALKKVGANTDKAEKWLLNKNITFSGLTWYLQVESSNSTQCSVGYSNRTYYFFINEDKTLTLNDTDGGECLSNLNGYWFTISSDLRCYGVEFKVSCDKSFLTTLLYQRKDSPTVYVSGKTSSASGSGSTKEMVTSLCFGEKNSGCDYEGTLWANFVLETIGTEHNVTSFLPYLTSMAEENENYLPESFLYFLTGDYGNDLLLKQQEDSWWSVSGDKFYDTAVALLPFQNSEITAKSNAKGWLEEVQDEDGCWQGGIRNTAFLLYSLWQKPNFLPEGNSDDDNLDCESSGFYCLSTSGCSSLNGSLLSGYTGCFGAKVCCNKNQGLQTCADLGGKLCSSTETCSGGNKASSSDSNSAKFCCVRGTCKEEKSECELIGGYCKSSCAKGEKLVSYDCDAGTCCVTKESKSYLWLIILLIVLIILAVLGIIFRKQLKEFLLKLKTKFFKKKSPPPQQKLPTTPSSKLYPGAVQRTIVPTKSTTPQPPAGSASSKLSTPPSKQNEFDDILKKLKDIGK